jgi:hypothetical protein
LRRENQTVAMMPASEATTVTSRERVVDVTPLIRASGSERKGGRDYRTTRPEREPFFHSGRSYPGFGAKRFPRPDR